MKKKSIQIFVVIFAVFLAVTLIGCRGGGEPEEPTPTTSETPSEAMLTEAAVTILAQLTQSVMDEFTATPTMPPPTATATATVPLPTPTGPTATPSETPLPTTTPIPTFTPVATLGPDDPKNALGNPDWQADFTNVYDWFYFDESFASFQSEFEQLVMTAKKTDSMDVWTLSWPVLNDFYLEYTATTGNVCDIKDRYGMVVRAPDTEAGYLFGLSCDGEYRLRYWDGIEFTELVIWTASDHIYTGPNQTNLLGVKAVGNRISLYVNGHLLHEVIDDTLLEGKFGSFIKAESTPGFQVRISKVVYWNVTE